MKAAYCIKPKGSVSSIYHRGTKTQRKIKGNEAQVDADKRRQGFAQMVGLLCVCVVKKKD